MQAIKPTANMFNGILGFKEWPTVIYVIGANDHSQHLTNSCLAYLSNIFFCRIVPKKCKNR